jgi:hypothetical protein
MGRECRTNGERGRTYRDFVGKLDRRLLGRLRRIWEDNNKINLRELGLGGMDWIDPAHDRDTWRADVNVVMNLQIPHNASNFVNK